GQDALFARHHVDQSIGDVAGVGVHQAQPGHVRRDLDEALQQRGEPILQAEVVPVIGGILRDQDDLPHAEVVEPGRLLDERLKRAADVRALDLGDGAERAGAAAAIRDLEVGAGALHGGAEYAALVGADGQRFAGQVVDRLGAGAPAQTLNQVEHIHPAPRADHAVKARHLLHQHVAVPLRETACRDQKLARLLAVRQLAQHVEAFLFGRVDEAAGVHDQHARLVGRAAATVALARKELADALRVNEILGAAQVDQVIHVLVYHNSSIPSPEAGCAASVSMILLAYLTFAVDVR